MPKEKKTRVKIEDLPTGKTISREEMEKVTGGMYYMRRTSFSIGGSFRPSSPLPSPTRRFGFDPRVASIFGSCDTGCQGTAGVRG